MSSGGEAVGPGADNNYLSVGVPEREPSWELVTGLITVV